MKILSKHALNQLFNEGYQLEKSGQTYSGISKMAQAAYRHEGVLWLQPGQQTYAYERVGDLCTSRAEQAKKPVQKMALLHNAIVAYNRAKTTIGPYESDANNELMKRFHSKFPFVFTATPMETSLKYWQLKGGYPDPLSARDLLSLKSKQTRPPLKKLVETLTEDHFDQLAKLPLMKMAPARNRMVYDYAAEYLHNQMAKASETQDFSKLLLVKQKWQTLDHAVRQSWFKAWNRTDVTLEMLLAKRQKNGDFL